MIGISTTTRHKIGWVLLGCFIGLGFVGAFIGVCNQDASAAASKPKIDCVGEEPVEPPPTCWDVRYVELVDRRYEIDMNQRVDDWEDRVNDFLEDGFERADELEVAGDPVWKLRRPRDCAEWEVDR